MFIAQTYLDIEYTGATAEADRRGSRRRRSTGGGRATKDRVTDEQLDEIAKTLATRLNSLVDRLPAGD